MSEAGRRTHEGLPVDVLGPLVIGYLQELLPGHRLAERDGCGQMNHQAPSHAPPASASRQSSLLRCSLPPTSTSESAPGQRSNRSGAALLEGPHAACGMTWPA